MGAIKFQPNNTIGFTMMEIMVVIFILAMFVGMTATRFRMGTDKDVNNQVKELALLGRHLRAQARIHNRTYRIVFEFPEEQDSDTNPVYTYKVEYSSQRVFLPGPEDELPQGREPEENLAQSSFMPADKFGENGTATLIAGLRVSQVEVESYPNPIQTERAMIHFFPNGRVEEAVVQLEWGSEEEGETLRTWSLYFRPFTGDPEVIPGRSSLADLGARP